jgi:predicted dienelactone hydrolase
MRLLEIMVSLANLLTFCILAIPRLHAIHWTGYLALITALIAGLQMLVEGPRWQMAPAYALALIFFLIWLLGIVMPNHVSRLIAGLGIGLGVLALVVSIALPIVLPVFHFPKPTGPYAIGTMTYHWVDTSRPELFTADPNDHRELMAQVWYPARNEPSAPRAPYIQDADAVTPAMARLTHFPRFFLAHFKYVTTNAVASAPMADDKSSYPVLVFLSGLDGFRAVNTFQIEGLVSHGYIVVGLDQPGAVSLVRFPDGRQVSGLPKERIDPLILQSVEPQPHTPTLLGHALPDGIIPYFAQDVSFALDQLTTLNNSDPNHILTGRLDLRRAGAFGISLGGMVAAQACLKDSRLQACPIMDVFMPADVVKTGLRQPSMFITRDADTMRLERTRAGGWSEKDIESTLTTMRSVYESLPGDGYYEQIPNIFHLNFTDFPYWSPITSQIGMTGPVNGQRMLDIINAYSLAFFDTHLNGQSTQLLDGPSTHYPEVLFEKR